MIFYGPEPRGYSASIPRNGALLEMRASGLSLREMASVDGRSVSTIRRILAANGRGGPRSAPERFWRRVEKTETCWLWTGCKDSSGYGQFRREDGRQEKAHRFSYTYLRGPIPDGLQLDHLCRVRNCVNPDHLEPVTARVNTLRSPIGPSAVNARKQTCDAGHDLNDPTNWFPSSGRTCRQCQQERQSRRVTCPSCGRNLRADSLYRHQARTACISQELAS